MTPIGHRSSVPSILLQSNGGTRHVVFPTPVLSTRILEDLASALRRLSSSKEPEPLVLRSQHPTVFLAGADLREIAALDPTTCIAYSDLGRTVVGLLNRHPTPTVAAVHGSCSGGGFDLAMACDAIVAAPRATFEHPGNRRGLVTGWSGTVSTPSAVGTSAARAVLIGGHRIDSQTALKLGLVSRVASDSVAGAAQMALEISALHPARLPLWRQLRGHHFVDRFRASVIHKL